MSTGGSEEMSLRPRVPLGAVAVIETASSVAKMSPRLAIPLLTLPLAEIVYEAWSPEKSSGMLEAENSAKNPPDARTSEYGPRPPSPVKVAPNPRQRKPRIPTGPGLPQKLAAPKLVNSKAEAPGAARATETAAHIASVKTKRESRGQDQFGRMATATSLQLPTTSGSCLVRRLRQRVEHLTGAF